MPAPAPPTLTLDPPAGFRDTTEYTYDGPSGRQMTISAGGPPCQSTDDLLVAVRAFSFRLTDLTGANVVMSAVKPRKAGGEVVELALPPVAKRRLRVALVRTGSELRRVTLDGKDPDARADADFIEAIETLTAPKGYKDVTPGRTFGEIAGVREVQVSFVAVPLSAEAPQRSAGKDEAGRSFDFELLPRPKPAGAVAISEAVPLNAVAERPSSPAVERVVAGRRLVVEVRGPAVDANAAALAAQVADSARVANTP